jgi:hypothetical protein
LPYLPGGRIWRSVGRKRVAKWRRNRNGKRRNKDDEERARSSRVTKMGSDERAGYDHYSLKSYGV